MNDKHSSVYHFGILRGFLCAHDAPSEVLAAADAIFAIEGARPASEGSKSKVKPTGKWSNYRLGDYARMLIAEGSNQIGQHK